MQLQNLCMHTNMPAKKCQRGDTNQANVTTVGNARACILIHACLLTHSKHTLHASMHAHTQTRRPACIHHVCQGKPATATHPVPVPFTINPSVHTTPVTCASHDPVLLPRHIITLMQDSAASAWRRVDRQGDTYTPSQGGGSHQH